MEEQDDKTVTEWMRKQVRNPALQIMTSCTVDRRQAGLSRAVDSCCTPCPATGLAIGSLLSIYHRCLQHIPIDKIMNLAWQPIETSYSVLRRVYRSG